MADTFDVIMAAYPSVGLARQDFDGLVRLVKDKRVRTEGVILVEHDEDGEVRVTETGDHLGRKGLGWGGGVGAVVGLFSPPLLASVVVGAAAGGVAGAFARHRVASGIQTGIGEQLPPGSAGIIAVVNHADRLAAEQALPGSPMKSVAQMEHHTMGALKDALATAAGKFSPDRTVLPIPDPSFGGTIGRTLAQSQADWTINMTPAPPDGAPNVLLVLIDDAGFGNPSTFGGPVDTPAMSRVAQAGLSYDRFHVTALCSPTRAAMLTGRNHHSVGFGSIGEFPGPFPGYTAARPKDCAPFVRMLQGNGYSTGGFGKWHMTPDHVQGAAGPFDRWPNSWGFDHFWGLLGGEAGQYDPVITQDNTIIGVPAGKDGQQYYLPDDLTDQAVGWLHAVRAQDQAKPWFLFYSTGCSHAPHQVPAEWSEKYRGRFDAGWDAYREQTFARQKQLGVIPGNAELTPRPAALPAWDSLSAEEKKLYARQMEVYAGYQENADWNVGRLLDAIGEMGGFSLFVQDGKLRHTYSMMGVEIYRQESTEALPAGDVMVCMQFDADAPKPGTGGTVTLSANDRKIGEGRIDKTVPVRFSGYSGMDIGRDNGLPVDRKAYGDKSPFPFTGSVKKVVFDLAPAPREQDRKAVHEAHHHMAVAHGISA